MLKIFGTYTTQFLIILLKALTLISQFFYYFNNFINTTFTIFNYLRKFITKFWGALAPLFLTKTEIHPYPSFPSIFWAKPKTIQITIKQLLETIKKLLGYTIRSWKEFRCSYGNKIVERMERKSLNVWKENGLSCGKNFVERMETKSLKIKGNKNCPSFLQFTFMSSNKI